MNPEPIVLIPGHMCDHRVFQDQVKGVFNDRGVSIPVITSLESITGIAEMTLASCPSTFALAGHSMGGIVAMEMYRLAPERISRLALISTNHKPEKPEVARQREARIDSVKKGNLREVIRDEMKPAYLHDGPYKNLFLKFIMVMALDLGASVFIKQSRALISRPDQTATLSQVDVPVALIFGEEDQLCPPEYHFAMKNLIPHAEIFAISESGHMTMIEQPSKFDNALKEWISLQ
ncbi:MAG: alpha/beta hydrolase [Rhodobacteraceae bacterium]|nr:alpha/beta hydrolase [Paracoccaceae bacterium]MCY4251405.1 alpha/beta hydrolase [Paracoccaceae bacterium]